MDGPQSEPVYPPRTPTPPAGSNGRVGPTAQLMSRRNIEMQLNDVARAILDVSARAVADVVERLSHGN